MGALEFIAEVVGALSWPVAIVIIVAIFRKAIADQINRLISLRAPGGVEMQFVERKVLDIERRLPQVLPWPDAEPISRQADSRENKVPDALIQLAPRTALLEAWNLVEDAVQRAAARVEVPPSDSTVEVLRELTVRAEVPAELLTLADDMRTVRNSVVHGTNLPIPSQSARSYVDAAVRIAAALDHIAHE